MNKDESSNEESPAPQTPISEEPRDATPAPTAPTAEESKSSPKKVESKTTQKAQQAKEKSEAPAAADAGGDKERAVGQEAKVASSATESGKSGLKKKEKGTLESLLSEGEDTDEIKIRKAKRSKNITVGICHILATFNNTRVSFSDMKGNIISWSSAGKCNFRGSRKSTSYAAQVVTQDAGRKAMAHGCKEVIVKVKGPGMGRDSAIRALQSLGFVITSIIEVTPIPHNGCRPPKRRRV